MSFIWSIDIYDITFDILNTKQCKGECIFLNIFNRKEGKEIEIDYTTRISIKVTRKLKLLKNYCNNYKLLN